MQRRADRDVALVYHAFHSLAGVHPVSDRGLDGFFGGLGDVSDQTRSGSQGLWFDDPRSRRDLGSNRFSLFRRTDLLSSDPVLFYLKRPVALSQTRYFRGLCDCFFDPFSAIPVGSFAGDRKSRSPLPKHQLRSILPRPFALSASLR